MNEACKQTNSKKFPNPNHPNVKHLKRIANAFMQLQQHRHVADYNNSKKWTRIEVLTDIELAADTFDRWDKICDQQVAQDFLLQLLIQRTRRS